MGEQESGEITKSDSRKLSWIKLLTNCFDDEKIRLIDAMMDRDTILVIWFKLLTQAGRSNASGHIILSENIPFTPKNMATLFNRTEDQICYALNTFVNMGMIEVIGGNVFLRNFRKHNPQISEKANTCRRVALFRERKRLSADESKYKAESVEPLQIMPVAPTWEHNFLNDLKATGKCPSLTFEGLRMVTRNFDSSKLSSNWGEIVVEARDHSDHVLNNPTVWLRAAISRMETRLIMSEKKSEVDPAARRRADLVHIPDDLRIGGMT
jgi:predicted phage replisome organizer